MLKNLKNKKKKRGFTLIELIIVIAIIAILAVLAIPKFGEIKKDANFKSDIANAKTIANAATTLYAEGNLTDGNYVVNTTSDTDLEKYLQNPPVAKSKGYSNFDVKITNGNVEITMTDDSTPAKTTKLFPVPDSSAK